MFKMIANGIEVQMFAGICDFEYKEKQKVMVNVTLQGNPKFAPTHITECMDYSKVCKPVMHPNNPEDVLFYEISFGFIRYTILFEAYTY